MTFEISRLKELEKISSRKASIYLYECFDYPMTETDVDKFRQFITDVNIDDFTLSSLVTLLSISWRRSSRLKDEYSQLFTRIKEKFNKELPGGEQECKLALEGLEEPTNVENFAFIKPFAY